MTARRTAAAALATVVVLGVGLGAWRAATAPQVLTVTARAAAVEATLRCPTCQGLSVAESTSPIAAGIRQQIRRRLAAGASPAQIRSYYVARYGDWILLSPPRRGVGWVAWGAPVAVLLAGATLLARTLGRRRPAAALPAPARGEPTEEVAAALADVTAARLEADFDAAAEGGLAEALHRLAVARARQPGAPAVGAVPLAAVSPPAEAAVAGPAGRLAGRRYLLPAAAVAFVALLAVALSRTVGPRPAGGLPTGNLPGATASPPATAGAVLAALRAATRAHPTEPSAWLAYATALDAHGELAAAEPAYRRTLALDPANVTARERLAWLLTRGGSPTEALATLAVLVDQRPDDPQVVLLDGLAQFGAHQPQAATTLRRYLSLAPKSAQAPMVRALLGGGP